MANASLEHPSFDRVQELEQQAEESQWEIERITPIFGQFQQKVGSAEQSMPEDAPEDVQEEEKEYEEGKEDEGGKEDEEDQEEQHEEELEQTKEKPLEVDSSDDADEEIV